MIISKHLLNKILISAIGLIFVGCAGSSDEASFPLASEEVGNEDPAFAERPFDSRIPAICSALDFSQVTWPADYRESDQVAFSLAMNITGSFEGYAGWTNLSNNFDNQGVSMGILNQNLGQGTLQPLLIKMRDNHLSVLESALTESMLESMLDMLSDWESSKSTFTASLDDLTLATEKEPINLAKLSGDIDKFYAAPQLKTGSNSASVRWAKRTLYTNSSGTNFKSAWKTALKTIAGDPSYVSLQIEAARYIHDRTHEYKRTLGWNELRSYLFLFDIVVQNGSLREKHFRQFDNWLASHPQSSEEEQMLEMLEIRVVDSHPKWQNDVRRRKTTVILGVGEVHGEDRDLPVEYCYDPVIDYESPEAPVVTP